jgi:hypothetical protein
MNWIALTLAAISVPFCVWLWKGLKRELARPLTEDEVRLGLKPERTIEVAPVDLDLEYLKTKRRQHYPEDSW